MDKPRPIDIDVDDLALVDALVTEYGGAASRPAWQRIKLAIQKAMKEKADGGSD